MKTAPVNTDRDNGSFSIILASHKVLVLISTRIGDFTDFFRDISLDNETSPQRPQAHGGSLWRLLCLLVHPKTQHLKCLFGADIVYLQQLQQVISNDGGGPQLLTQGCVCAYRAASQMGGTFSPRWREQRENLKQLVLRDCLWLFRL